MKELKESSDNYFKELNNRARKSRVHSDYQLSGLEIAKILEDRKHKSLYIKLAKKHDSTKLLALAKSVAERKYVSNKGAYFMKLLTAKKDGNSNHRQ